MTSILPFLRILLLGTAPLALSGCSVLIASGGRQKPWLRDASKESVHKALGKPLRTVRYPTPMTLGRLPELQAHRASLQAEGTDIPIVRRQTVIGYREDFQLRGWYRDYGIDDAAGAAMYSAGTFGLLEPVVLPLSVAAAAKGYSQKNFVQVWFTPRGRCVYYLWDGRAP
jgi:hypothetical protein